MPCVGSYTVQSLANVRQMRTSINGFGRYSNLSLFLTMHGWLSPALTCTCMCILMGGTIKIVHVYPVSIYS